VKGRTRFWIAQARHLMVLAAVLAAIVIVWIWLAGAHSLATSGAFIAAGLTVALQRVVTAFAGYLIILRGNVFSVGDRITIGGVRGDVVALGFMQTTVMEMGQSPGEQRDDPSMWIHGRQYSGRIVRVTNDRIFDTPIYNYTRDFPYMWDELMVPVRFADDYRVVERILMDVAQAHTAGIVAEARRSLEPLQSKYFLSDTPDIEPRVFMRITDNWTELAVRFIGRDRGIRGLRDAMSRDILDRMNAAHIGVASGTYAIVEVPPLTVSATTAPPAA
jgi:small-conductance mechanosensitive channel